MTVSEVFLERKIATLNEWLQNNEECHFTYSQKLQNRNYYVNKLCDMHELGMNIIKI